MKSSVSQLHAEDLSVRSGLRGPIRADRYYCGEVRQKEIISEIVFNTSMTGYEEVLTDPSYTGQAVVMTYPLIGNYGVCEADMQSGKPHADAFIVRDISRLASSWRAENTLQNFLRWDRRNRYERSDKTAPGSRDNERMHHDSAL